MDDQLIQWPHFARISDYFGLWSMEPGRFAFVWDASRRIDVAAHMADREAAVKSSVEKMSTGNGEVAVVRVNGLLMKSQSSLGGTSTIQMRRDIRQAAVDPNVSAILLAVDSPGGTVAGTDDLAADVRAARKVKPVWAHVDDLSASAAYWVTSQAERVYANSPTALIGSIGVLQVVRDFSAAAEREGIKTHVIGTGPLKGLGTPGAPVTDEQLSHLRSLVESTQQHFAAAVRKGRRMSAAELSAVTHGGVMSAEDAVGAKLIDGIQSLGKTINELAKSAGGYDPRRAMNDVESAGRSGGIPVVQLSALPTLRALRSSDEF